MARCQVLDMSKFVQQLNGLEHETDAICEKMIEAGVSEAFPIVYDNLRKAIGSKNKVSSKSTGELLSALGKTNVKLSHSKKFNAKIGFKEPRSRGRTQYGATTNAMVGNILEYGSSKHRQEPRPWLKPSKSKSKRAVEAKMEQVFNSEVRNVTGN